jgi:branched-chain amino acid transport system substrate-binding protein
MKSNRTMQSRHLALIAIAAVTAAGLAACSGGDASATGDDGECEVRALSVGQLTGAQAQVGTDVKAGTEQAVTDVNEAGGINGCTLVVDFKDDGSDYTKTLPVVQAATSEYDGYININISSGYGAASAMPFVTKSGYLSINSNAVPGLSDPKVNPFDFSVTNVPTDTDSQLVQRIIADGHKKIAIMTDNTVVGTGAIESATAIAKSLGAEVVASQQVDLATVNMTPPVQALKSSGADALYIALYGEQAGYFIRDLRASEWDVAVYGGQYTAATDLASLVPVTDIADILLFGASSTSSPPREEADQLLEQIKASGDKITSLQIASSGYDVIAVLAWAANEAGSNDASAIAKVLEENGDAAIPGYIAAVNTGFSASNHAVRGEDGIAIMQGAEWDEFGLLPRLEFVTFETP